VKIIRKLYLDHVVYLNLKINRDVKNETLNNFNVPLLHTERRNKNEI
jgi:hypothetical protein